VTIREQVKQQRKEVMKNGTPREKVAYFFDYYTLHLILAITIIVIAVSLIVNAVRKPEVVLSGIVLNVFNYENKDPVEDLGNDYLKQENLNSDKYKIDLNATLTYRVGNDSTLQYHDIETSQAILTQCAAGSIDFMISPLNSVIEYANNGIFVNLEEVLSDEEFKLYEPYFLYVDQAVVEEKDKLVNDGGNPDDIPTPDPTKPEEMKEPIPVLIDISGCKKVSDIYNYTDDTLAFGVTIKAPNSNRIPSFLEFLFKE